MKEIGDFLRLHHTTISVIIRQTRPPTSQFKTGTLYFGGRKDRADFEALDDAVTLEEVTM